MCVFGSGGYVPAEGGRCAAGQRAGSVATGCRLHSPAGTHCSGAGHVAGKTVWAEPTPDLPHRMTWRGHLELNRLTQQIVHKTMGYISLYQTVYKSVSSRP